MQKPLTNYAFIDSQNLNLGVQTLGWKLDYKRFRIYLKEKYGVKKAYLFLGFLPKNKKLYQSLKNNGYALIFKPIINGDNKNIKGNVDAELVLQAAAIDFKNYQRALVVSGDGDFYCLIKFLLKEKKFLKLLAPNSLRCSSLLKVALKNTRKIIFINNLKKILRYKKPAD